jgi:hypothetical protein
MLKSIIKKRVSFALAILLTVIMLLQLSPTALAGINGGGVSATSTPQGTSGQAIYNGWTHPNIAIFLTNDHNFTMDTAELRVESGRLVSGDKMLRETPTSFEDYKGVIGGGISIDKLYAQVFRRTFVSWGDPRAMDTIFVTGKTFYNNVRSGSIQYISTGLNAAPTLPANARTVGLDESAYMVYNNGPPVSAGHGIAKDEILQYLKDYFEYGPDAVRPPEKFFEDLYMRIRNSEGVYDVLKTWAYIAGGVGATMFPEDYTDDRSAAERWSACYSESDEPAWADTYVTEAGLVDKNGKPLWSDEPGSFAARDGNLKQIAGYLDTLLSLSVLSYLGAPDGISKLYRQAAVDVFGEANTMAQNPGQLVFKDAIVISKAIANDWDDYPYTVTDYMDFWSSGINKHGSGVQIQNSFDSQNIRANDWDAYPSLEWGKRNPDGMYATWIGSKANESMDRARMRYAMMTPTDKDKYGLKGTNLSPLFLTGDIRAAAALGATAARMGKDKDATVEEEIDFGVPFGGSDTTGTATMVGLQFLIGMFAHAEAPDPVPLTHSLHVAQQPIEVIEYGAPT